MRHDNPEFASYNQAQNREPNFVVEISFDSANTDLLYLTKEAVTSLTGPNVVDGVLESISGTTQKLDPRKALSTIGSMSFSAVDDTLTATQKTKLQGGDGLRGKRVRFYVGAVGLDWSGFMLAQTQIIDTVTYKDNAYSFKCSDIQREMRKDIFDLKKTALADDLSRDDTTITVFNTNEFEMVKHPASIDGKPHKPGVEVGYLKITQGDDIEIISYEGPNTATTFTNCTRGVFNTKPLEILLPRDEFDNIDVEEDNAPKVEEYVYLELPAPMLAYALLTGSIYGELGKTLPDHWHLGISTDYVKTSDFTNIGVDWWDTTNADKGIVPVLKGLKKTDGKKFIEEQIYRMLGAFSPVYSTGELGLKRLTVVHSMGGYVRKLDETNVVSYGELTHDMKSVINRFVITWNWVEAKQAYTRTNILIDSDSIAAHGEAEPLKLELRALASSRHSKTTLKERFDSIRDRYAGPPLRLDLTLTPEQNDLEVGDIVRVDLDAVLDYSGEETDHTVNRNFEVQQVSTDWVTGDVKVKLFGSSQKAGALTAVSSGSEVGTALTAGFWTATGTQLNNAFNANITSGGGITTISGDITLTGNDDLTNSGAIYYCNEDLVLQAGATITITKNVQIRVNGVFEINGDIDGAGNGTTGGAGVSCYREIVPGNVPNYASESLTWVPAQKFIGASSSQPGVSITTILSTDHFGHVPGGQYEGGNSVSVGLNVGQAPELTLSINDDATEILGIPSDISGQPGAGGGAIYERNYNAAPGSDDDSSGYGTHLADGGAGGAGGAGLMLITQGVVFGASGFIDTSGGDGSNGSPYVFKTSTLFSGKGAGGAPGAVYFVFTDSNANIPNINNSTLRCYFGSSDASSYSTVYNMEKPSIPWAGSGTYSFGYRNTDPSPDHTVNVFDNWKKVQFVEGVVGTVQDYPEKADDVVSFTLTEYTNTPPSQQGNISTIEVSVTAPSDPNYSYAFIQYKNALNSPWLDAGPASPEGTWQVPSDGKTYYVRALSVSKDNVMSSTGPQDSITVADVVNDPDTEAPTVMTFDNITVTCESGGATFTGKDAKFSWTDTNKDKLHFLEYKVEIKDGSANLMRTERTKDAFYVYTYEKNKEDYEAYHTSAGANRSITITVTVVGAIDVTGGKYEGPTDSLSVSNPAPSAVGSLVVSPGYQVIYVNGTNPTDLDFTQFAIYISQASGFTAGPANLLGYASKLPVTITADASGTNLASGTTYYIRIESHDEFGAGGITTDYSALMSGALVGTEIPVNEELIVDGRIIADASGDPYEVVMGPQTVDSRAALFNFKNTTTGTHYFALFEDGTVEVNGKIIVNTGSDIDYAYVTGATKPEDNATANDFNQAVLSGGSVSFNPDLTIVGADGRPAGVKAHYGNSDTTNVAYYDAEKTILKVDDPTDPTLAVAFPAFRVIPGVTYTAHIRIRMENSAATSGIYFVFEESYSDLPAGKTYVGRNVGTSESGGVERDTIIGQLNNAGCGTTWEEHTFTYTPSANAKYASASFYNWTGNPAGNALLIDRCYVSSNATAGATWGTDITGQPADSDLLNSQQQWSAVIGSGKPDDDATQNTIFHQTSTPTGTLGDMWYKTDSSEFYQHDGSSWVLTATENRVYSQSSTPSGTVGDLWYKTDTYEYYQHDGATWVPVGDITSQKTSNDTANVNGTSAATIDQGAGRANSGLNASGQITQIVKGVNLPSTGMSTGLNLTSTYMGYYNGTSWGSYIQSNGNFHFGGSGSNYIEWNGSTLTMVGDFQTATSGQRIELDNSANKLMFKDSSGITRVDIDDGTSIKGYIDISATSTKMGLTIVGAKYGIDSDGSTWGVLGSSPSGSGVKGTCITSSGKAVEGAGSAGYAGYFSNTGSQHCVYAVAHATSGVVIGGFFNSGSTSGRAVQGNATASSGTTYGGYFDASSSSSSRGIFAHGGQYGAYLYGGTYDAYLANTGAGPFTGSHDALLSKSGQQPEVGDIVINVGIAAKDSIYNVIPYVEIATEAESKAVYGVFANVVDLTEKDKDKDKDKDKVSEVPSLQNIDKANYDSLMQYYRRAIVNGLGEGQINVCDDNGDIEIGDFICTSATPGKGQLYTGSDMRVVVAKAMEPVDWSQESETTKMIACIYMCS